MPRRQPVRLFVSDLHLESPQSRQFQRFSELLAAWRETATGIYLLGDITELWVGDDDDSTLAEALREVLTATARFCPVYLMHGNRDFLYGASLAEATGIRLIDDPTRLEDGVLLAHGDAWCTDDVAYQQFRSQVRSPGWQSAVLGQSLEQRRAFGAALRARSRETNANKAANIMDVNARALLAELRQTGCHSVVHGHTHRPGVHGLESGQRLVLGAWDGDVGWFGLQTGEHLSLHAFSLAHRYENAAPDLAPE